MRTRIDAILVAVPAHDEEELLEACLRSVLAAADEARTRVRAVAVCVALDRCTDGSAEIARALHVPTVAVDAGIVGVAREAGVAHANTALRSRLPGLASRRIWTAHTDADSVVPANWLTHQLDLAADGAEVIIGTVRPRFTDLDDDQVRAWHTTHTPGVATDAVHGANLGIRADVLRRAGGFPAIPVHEDVRLVERARTQGARIALSDEAWVLTSGRPFGRAPDGYSRYLREDMIRDAADRAGVVGSAEERVTAAG